LDEETKTTLQNYVSETLGTIKRDSLARWGTIDILANAVIEHIKKLENPFRTPVWVILPHQLPSGSVEYWYEDVLSMSHKSYYLPYRHDDRDEVRCGDGLEQEMKWNRIYNHRGTGSEVWFNTSHLLYVLIPGKSERFYFTDIDVLQEKLRPYMNFPFRRHEIISMPLGKALTKEVSGVSI